MEEIKINFPSRLIHKISQNAPSYQTSENYGRSGGYYGGSEEYGRSYKSISIYVQNGLYDQIELFKEISKSIFKIQSNNKFSFQPGVHPQKKYRCYLIFPKNKAEGN